MSATETFSAPAEVQTFDGLLSDFDGTIVDSTDGMEDYSCDSTPQCDTETNSTFLQQQS
jgi:beta-phosphoglucomutase-like phosphatase (HAD superfamily)